MKQIDCSQRDIFYKPELFNMRCLFYVNAFLLLAVFLMPQYFGIHIGWDITCTRLANMVLVFYALLNIRVLNLFTDTVRKCILIIPLGLYLFVALYTMVFRIDINSLMLPFLEVLTLFMLLFGIRYVIGVYRSFRMIIGCAYFLGLYGFLEFAAGHSLYLQFLSTVPNTVANCYRSGFYRIMGPCGHPLGYGLLLILLIAISCVDIEKDEIYIFRRPFLLVILLANVFLTGSRSSQGVALLELFLLFLFSKSEKKKKAVFYIVVIVVVMAIFLVATCKTRIGRYVLMQITSLIDQVFDTSISANFGADVTTLKNSESYREYLPQILHLSWLNPLIGRGIGRGSFGAEIVTEEGVSIYIKSIDNYYIALYVRYAYPGLISYVIFIVSTLIYFIRKTIANKSGFLLASLIGIACYYFNLWWLDYLQTLKFTYTIVALCVAFCMVREKSTSIE